VVVCPAFQGQGLGKMLFEQLIFLVESERNDILRIELIARESNQKAIGLYQRLGFVIEGRLEKRIYANGKFEADIPMVWFNQKYIG
jgi:ribosomal protein S18 acetylase RimI-like enzyme